MGDPELLIMDEPAKGFDPVNRRLLMNIIEEQRKAGATIIYVTHQMEEVERLCDRLILLKDGQAAAYGTLEEVKSQFGGASMDDIFVQVYGGEAMRYYQVSLLAGRQALVEKLNDDLDTPGALALIDEVFSKLDHTPLDKIHRQSLVQFIDEIDEILGLDLAESTPDITDDLKRLIIQRRQARAEKNWEESDRIRDELLQAGVAVRDTPSGSVWTWK
jgi:ABC-type multidrug transport system ATPase subunit